MENAPDPPPRQVKLRYRALAYWRRFGGHRRSPRRVSLVNSRGASVSLANSSSGGVALHTPSRTGSRTRSSTARKARETHGKRRHRLLAPLHERGGGCGAVAMLLCGCQVDLNAFEPGQQSASFHWGVGFDDSSPASKAGRHRLSTGTQFRLGLCGLHVAPRSEFSSSQAKWRRSSLDASANSFDSGSSFIAASPVACPKPRGLVPTRAATTRLQLRSRDGTGSGGEFAYDGDSGGFSFSSSSTGVKRKAPSSSSPSDASFTPTTPPSPFVNDFRPADTLKATRERSRVSVGCNGWLLADDDPVLRGWRRSSGHGGRPRVHPARLSELAETTSYSDGESERKRRRTSACVSGRTSGASSSSRASRASLVLLSNCGSVSSGRGGLALDWRASSTSSLAVAYGASSSTEFMVKPRPSFPTTPPTKESQVSGNAAVQNAFSSSGYASMAEYEEYEDVGGLFVGDDPPAQASVTPVEETERGLMGSSGSASARDRTSFSARLSASLRRTKAQSPTSLRRALSPVKRRRQTRRSSSSGKRRFRLGAKAEASKSASPPRAELASSPSIVFIDCPP